MNPHRSIFSGPFTLGQGWRSSLSDLSAWLERQNKLVLAVAATVAHALLYGAPNRIHLAQPVELPMTGLDRAIPFIPLTFFLYLSDYLLVFVAFLLCRRQGSTARFILSFFTVVGVATLVHWVWPTVYPRALYPVPEEASSFMRWMVTRFRALDNPTSCLPSLHVAAAFLSAFAVVGEGDRRAPALLAWAVLIWGSTLTTKQHYVVDGAAGLLLAVAVWALFYSGRPDRLRRARKSPRGMGMRSVMASGRMLPAFLPCRPRRPSWAPSTSACDSRPAAPPSSRMVTSVRF